MAEGRVRIKFCGIKRLKDVKLALELGVDALGFIFYPLSPRVISITDAREIAQTLPPFVTKVGVFVDSSTPVIAQVVERVGLELVQLCGDESVEMAAQLPCPFVKVFRELPSAAELMSFTRCENFRGFVADGKPERPTAANQYGGSGQAAARDLVLGLQKAGRLILAGGLTPDTVAAAAADYRPYAVDVSSGIESAPGVKSPKKMREFVAAVESLRP
ncbi:MAG: phosphoribosylanthranilate isomerase [Alphaproteobacteria bacterium]|nr:phosphoribosylanthranilate isomerase [Alphaproteobacteria bacterium]